MDLTNAMEVAATGMKAQGQRLRVVAQNLANAQSAGLAPGDEPYRRKTISFRNLLDRERGVELVEVARTDVDRSAFPLRYDPNHPAAMPTATSRCRTSIRSWRWPTCARPSAPSRPI
jgi:flagellar basal-body rod protein FlgC